MSMDAGSGRSPRDEGSAVAGWYGAEEGFVRWWDGTGWGPPCAAPSAGQMPPEPVARRRALLPGAAPGDHTATLVVLSHLGFVLGAFIMPLSVYLVEKSNPYVRHHAAEGLNFQLTVLLAVVVSLPLMLVVVGFFTLAAAVAADVVFGIVAAVQASRGVWFRYPLNLRIVRP